MRWAVAGRMAVAWLVTLPAAGLVGALSYWLSIRVKSLTGAALVGDGLIFLILVGLSFYMWWRAQQQKVDSSNVNADWTCRPTRSFRPRCAGSPPTQAHGHGLTVK